MQNKINTFIGIFALIVSLVALYFSYKANLDRSENLRLSLNPLRSGYTTKITPPFHDKIPPLINTTWELVITNTSDRTIAILKNQLYMLEKSTKSEYTGLNQGIYTLTGEKADFPINIEPGKSVKYYVHIGYEITKKSFDYFNNKFDISNNMSMMSLKKAMCQRGKDVKDNTIECINHGTSWSLNILSSPTKDNYYIFNVNTARDNSFHTVGFWYKEKTTY
ncbi:hypothetical protein [Sulfurovum sp.]|uniref:hypothetical protein n=1 Tax=Sulfurovum sp. TaxID=1969726 RepID=UPI00356AA30C